MDRRQEHSERQDRQRLQALVARGVRARWWRRQGSKQRGFRYVDLQGQPVQDEKQLERIRSLSLPPAWKEVRIAPSPRSRLQAVGVDTSGRIQYRYQEQYVARQARKKYAKIERFGEALPQLRRLTNAHLALAGLPRERVLAVIVRLIDHLFFRLGSEKSVRQYRTYGITTLRNRHLEILPAGELRFHFIGKHHVRQKRLYVDPELAALLTEVKALRGSHLFQYLDENGRAHPVTPGDVNRYIKAAIGPEYSAKDFRTWGGTLLAAIALAKMDRPENEAQMRRRIVEANKRVAAQLGNTPTVCRECYIHPIVFDRYRAGITLADFPIRPRRVIPGCQPDYTPEEQALLQLFHAV